MVENLQPLNGITAPKGFLSSGVHSGLKKSRRDLTVIFSEKQAAAAAVFTSNAVKAAPLLVDIEHLKKTGGFARAVIVNSGNANACTGEQGVKDAYKMAALGGEMLDVSPEQVLISSTGVIGVSLPMDKIEKGIEDACKALSKTGGSDAAEGIMTTDKVIKEDSIKIDLDGNDVYIGGIAKGSGMIHPNMATMLCFITTDAAVEEKLLKETLVEVNQDTFNMISVDGDTSTNDMVVVLANGEAKNLPIKAKGHLYDKFKNGLYAVCKLLARKIVLDGEGATKLLEVVVKNAVTKEDARKAARKVTESSLVKTALFGEDANWGRVMMAVGNSGAAFNPERVDIFLESSRGKEQMMDFGMGLNFSEEKASFLLQEKEIRIVVDFKDGDFSSTAWGCDLSYDYVKINADYRT